MRVLVAGGAGYIGCVLARQLLQRGHAVRVCDRLFYGHEGLTDIRDQIELAVEDVRSVPRTLLAGIDAVVNLAGISSDPTAEFEPELTRDMNVTGALHLAEVCLDAGVRRYLFASSCSIYDSGRAADDVAGLLDETSPVSPKSAYARSKLEAERALLRLRGTAFAPVCLRKGTVFGYSPRMRFDLVINTLLKDALSCGCMTVNAGGQMWRPIIEVHDAARAYIACLEADDATVAGQVFNIVYSNARVSEMALTIRATLGELGLSADIRTDDAQRRVRSYRVSGDMFQRRVGFRPEVGIEASVKRSVSEMRRRGLHRFDDPKHYNIRVFETVVSEARRPM